MKVSAENGVLGAQTYHLGFIELDPDNIADRTRTNFFAGSNRD
jgi:hypothetical protein